MTDKISCPTLNVVLIKAIRALCEVTIKFDHTLEITGSLHVRSDGDKVLTCLLNEDCIKSSSSHLNDVALKLSLVNAALALNNISIVQNSIISKANDVVANIVPQIASTRNLCSFSGEGAPSRSAIPHAAECMASSSTTHIYQFGGAHASSSLPDNNNNNLKLGKGTKSSSSRCRKKVETVARTLANIKTHALSDRSMDFNPMEVNIATVKLPDIQTLAHRLPSYKAATNEMEGIHNLQAAKVNVHSPSPNALLMVPLKHPSESIIKKEAGEEEVEMKLSNQKGQQRVKKFQCMFCGIFLSTKCYLKNHVNAMHTRLHVYKCDLCEHSFYSAGAMRIHKLRNHWHDSKKHRCPECNESFLLPIELRKHLQKRHHLQATTSSGTSVIAPAFATKRQRSPASAASGGAADERGAVDSSANLPAESKPPENLERMKVEPGEFSQSAGAKKVSSSSSPGYLVRNGISSKSV